MTVLLMLRSAAKKASAPSDKGISELNHTPRVTAVYASRPALPPDSRNTRLQAARYALPGLDFHQLTAPAYWTHPLPTLRSPVSDSGGGGSPATAGTSCKGRRAATDRH